LWWFPTRFTLFPFDLVRFASVSSCLVVVSLGFVVVVSLGFVVVVSLGFCGGLLITVLLCVCFSICFNSICFSVAVVFQAVGGGAGVSWFRRSVLVHARVPLI
jgi:hypothetical protein